MGCGGGGGAGGAALTLPVPFPPRSHRHPLSLQGLRCGKMWPELAPRPGNPTRGHNMQPQPGSAAGRARLAAYPPVQIPAVALNCSPYATRLGCENAGLDAWGRVMCA